MKLVATYANRRSDPEIVELVLAWDEFCVEGNYEGWQAEKAQQLASWGDDLYRHVDVEIDVPMHEIYKILIPEPMAVTPTSVALLDP